MKTLIFNILLLVSGCRTYDYVSTPAPTTSHERIEDRYARPLDSDPEVLKPFYDPGLTQALNR